ncbi:MAG: pentapeptide repeat-containing protein [Acidobacteriia bacterium]|nr:pentapeptide repeat-containing protein [Terriglobia bacterium]
MSPSKFESSARFRHGQPRTPQDPQANARDRRLEPVEEGSSRCSAKPRRGEPLGGDLRGANLIAANLGGADLTAANLGGAHLARANLTKATIWYTAFGDNDLSDVKGLETVHHGGPSTIGIDTIYKSKGNIPEVFLRGCGVPKDFIVYMKSLAGKPIEFYS